MFAAAAVVDVDDAEELEVVEEVGVRHKFLKIGLRVFSNMYPNINSSTAPDESPIEKGIPA